MLFECALAWSDNASPRTASVVTTLLQVKDDAVKDFSRMGLTPPHRFRQAEPSKCLRGQTTSLSTSEAEKELVNEDFGGIELERGLMHGAARNGREVCTNTHSLDTDSLPVGQKTDGKHRL